MKIVFLLFALVITYKCFRFFFTEESKLVPLQRSESVESTQSEREFRKKYQAITHRMVHRKSSAVMYSRILERTFGKTQDFYIY